MLLTACSLDENPKDQIDESSIYTDGNALYQHAVAALYSHIGGNSDGTGLQGTIRGVYDLQTFASDEAIMPTRGVDWYDGGIWQDLYRHSWGAGHEIIGNAWLYLYKVVALCNRSLETLDKYNDLLTPRQYEEYKAEVRALRAIYYWYLMDLYGRVPLVTTTNASMNEVKQVERSEMFTFVRTELEDVYDMLANRRSTERGDFYGRVTRSVAAFMLAKIYLNAEVYDDDDWTDDEHIDGKDLIYTVDGREMNAWEACIYHGTQIEEMGFELEAEYKNNFAVYNETSKENIWIIPMDRVLFTNQQQNVMRSLHWRHADSWGFRGSNGSSATKTALATYHYGKDDEDPRFKENYWAGAVEGKNGMVTDRTGATLRYEPEEVQMDLRDSKYLETAGARMKKYEIDAYAAQKGYQPNNDIVLFRYADVALMIAEAKVRNGQSGDDYLSMIRLRVGTDDRSATLENIYEERLLELAWEGWRRNDMIRYGRYKSEHTGEKKVNEDDRHTTVFPIPSKVKDLNENLTQNKGY